MTARRQHAERGAAAVEFVLVFLPLMILLFGIIEVSRVFSLQLRLQEAAREAARTNALSYDDGLSAADLTALTNQSLVDTLGSTLVAGLDTKSIIECTDPADDAIVMLRDSVNLAIPAIPVPSIDVGARAQMPCEG